MSGRKLFTHPHIFIIVFTNDVSVSLWQSGYSYKLYIISDIVYHRVFSKEACKQGVSEESRDLGKYIK